ncbi:MAG: hypothetical protein H0W90_13445 [Actinobacteria bacterium]|nr:hypothetical protein [Actinomycetota bacterium]
MEHEAWPTPQIPAREPLPRVDDLPVAEQGYEQEGVRAAFDSFYRHAAQLDAALRTLEAVDSFHRSAASLRADLRSLRAAGWTQQSWTQPPSYGYGMRAPREGVPPAVWRIGGEVAFLVVVAVALGVAQLSWWAILLAMAGAFAIVCVIEWLAGREQLSFVRPVPGPASAGVHPVVEAQRAEDTDEHDSLGWTAFEEAQEPSDAMTIIGEPSLQDLAAETPEPEPEPDPEPELPPAAEADEPGGRRWWQRRRDGQEPTPEPDLPSHARVRSAADAAGAADPWEEGFDGGPGETEAEDEDESEPVLVEDREPGHSRPS